MVSPKSWNIAKKIMARLLPVLSINALAKNANGMQAAY